MASLTFPDPFICHPVLEHKGTIIMLHGRGSNGPEFARDFFESQLSSGLTLNELLPNYKWVFPTCPLQYDAVFEEEITQWYEISSLTDPSLKQETQLDGTHAALEHISGLVVQEVVTSPTSDVILGGISQGFSIAILSALISTKFLRALIGFSSWLPQYSKIHTTTLEDGEQYSKRASVSQKLRNTFMLTLEKAVQYDTIPIFLTHCSDDPAVDIVHGSQMTEVLTRLGHNVTWLETKDGGHWIKEPEAVDGLEVFLKKEGVVTG